MASVCPLVGEAGPKARAGFLVAGACSLVVELHPGVFGYKALGAPGLVLELWCVGPGPGPSDGQGCVQEWLWALGVLRKPVCWWAGLCPHLVSCLAQGIPAVVATGCWAGLGPEANKLEGEFQNDACQHQGPCGRKSSQKWLWPVSVSPA